MAFPTAEYLNGLEEKIVFRRLDNIPGAQRAIMGMAREAQREAGRRFDSRRVPLPKVVRVKRNLGSLGL